MAGEKQEFRISFCALLLDVTKILEWPEPIYSQANLAMNTANLVLLRGPRPNACFFKGETGRTLAESKEHAIEQVVDFLAQKKQVIVDGVNLERRNKYKACCQFLMEKREALESIEQPASDVNTEVIKKMKVVVPAYLPKMISVDLWDIRLQVTKAYKIIADEIDFITQSNGLYVYCFTITWLDHAYKERFFIGDNFETVERARQSLVKKVIQYFQTLYGFSMKNDSFNRMKYSQIQCGFQRRRYLFSREHHVCLPSDLGSVPVFISDRCQTLEGPAYGIQSGVTLPPPPNKLKPTAIGTFSISRVRTGHASAAMGSVSVSMVGNGNESATELQAKKQNESA